MKKLLGITSSLVVAFAIIAIAAPSASAAQPCLNEGSAKGKVAVSGLNATVSFTLPKSCGNQQVSLVSYKAPSTNGKPLNQQTVFQSTTQNLAPGTYHLAVQIPDCFTR
jgi:hypothetical protein